MYCRECGNEVNDKAEICINCGVRPLNGNNFCQACGAETRKEQEFCIKCGAKLIRKKQLSSLNDNPSLLVNLASCCFPIVGLVLYLVWRDEKPRTAKSVCIWGVVGFVIISVFYIFMAILGFIVESEAGYY